jgi:hypothetical protein
MSLDVPPSTERLRDAVLGLSGFVGAALVPMLAAWGRLLLDVAESDRASLGKGRGPTSGSVARVVGLTALSAFLAFTTVRAASDLRAVQLEAPVLGMSLQGLAAGVLLWAAYAAAWSFFRRGSAVRRHERRFRLD